MDKEDILNRNSKENSEDAVSTKKRAKNSNLRMIMVESDSPAIREGCIDVKSFVNSRKFEIRSLFEAMRCSRQLSAQRAFQSLPRFLRRRSASHNFKRVPKYLRIRAKNEIKNGNALKKKRIRRRKRMHLLTVHKLRKFGVRNVLASEVPKDELNESNEDFPKVKKVKGRFYKRQKDKTWLPTHLWHVKRAKMLTKWSYSIAKTPTGKSYRPTHKFANISGAVAFDTSYFCTICLWGEIENLKRVLQQFTASDSGVTRERYTRGTRFCQTMIYHKDSNFLSLICPALFLWQKIGDSQCVMIRFHPVAFKQVYIQIKEASCLENVKVEDCRFDIGGIDIHGPASTLALQCLFDVKMSDTISQIWSEIKYVSQIKSLPIGIVIPLDIRDPRLTFPPRIINNDKGFSDVSIKSWKDDLIPSSRLFDSEARMRCQKNQLSQQRINHLRSESSESSVPYDIPILLFRCEICWTILAPWNWITHLWHSLMHIPRVRFGGIQEKHQLEFEEGIPYFPSDYHGTLAGDENEKIEAQYREFEWKKKPPAKRVSWSSVVTKDGKGELGNPFICDWSYLFLNFSKNNSDNSENENKLLHMDLHLVSGVDVKSKFDTNLYKSMKLIFIVKITMLRRGCPDSCARVYSIPAEEKEIWSRFSKEIICFGDENYPLCPSSDNLLGFVTTGNFNLKRGKTTAIGCFALHKISKTLLHDKEKYCIIRNVGSSTVNIAKWDFVD